MPLLLRKIRKSRWLPVPDWTPRDTLHADPLADLVTQGNELSVWRVEDDGSNLERILTALAGNFDYASNLDYILFDERILQEADVRIRRSDGSTIMPEANSTWHHDLVELTARKVVNLAELAMQNGRKERVSESTVIRLVREAVQSGIIDPGRLKLGVRGKIEPL